MPDCRHGLGEEDMPTPRGHSSSFVDLEKRPKYFLLGHLAICYYPPEYTRDRLIGCDADL